jgi:hypothetical protein
MRLVEGFLRTGSYRPDDVALLRDQWGAFYDQADYGPYRSYGSDWPTSAIGLLDDLELGGAWTVATISSAAQAFAGIQMFRQDLSPFDPVVRREYQEYKSGLEGPLHQMARRLFEAMVKAGGSSGVELDAFPLDLTLPLLPEEARRRLTWRAPPLEYARLRELGLTIR